MDVNGNTSAFDITSISLNTNGTDNPNADISNATIYYTGTGPNFDTSVQFGSSVASPNGPFSITGTQTLVDGVNYFWLSYDIKSGATLANVVDAEVPQITVNSINRTPTVTAPAGSRTISSAVQDGSSCSAAIPVDVCGAVTVTGSTTGGDTSNSGNCVTNSNSTEKRWYKVVGQGTSITATTIDISDPNLDDTKLWVYTDGCGTLTCVTGNDDISGSNYYSSVTFFATSGQTYYVVVGGFNGPDVGNYQVDFSSSTNCMSYTSSTTTQNSDNLATGVSDQQVIGIEVVMTDALNALDVTSFTFNTTGTTSPATDISNAKVYYTGNSSTFSVGTQFGSTEASPNGTFSITDTQSLSEGTNYFWLTFDIASGATTGNVVDAQCTQIIVDAINRTPTVTAPSGNRTITSITPTRGNALSFDGNDYVQFTGYKGITGSNDRSIEAWVKTSSAGAIISWGTASAGQEWDVRVNSSGFLTVEVNGGDVTGTTDIRDGSWHHFAVVFSGSNITSALIYLDGTLESTTSNSQSVNTASGSDVILGNDLSNRYFTGEIDDVVIWNTAKTQSEIRQNMHLTLLGKETGLQNYWQLNATSGTAVNDYQLGGSNGILGDGVTSTTFPSIVASTAAIGGGTSSTQSISGTGLTIFSGTDFTMNVGTWGGGSDEFTVYKITGEDAPGNDPLSDIPSLNGITSEYWVVRHFGVTSFTTSLTIALGNGTIDAADEASPSNLKLAKRSSSSFGAWSEDKAATSASVASGTCTFDGVTSFSQFKVGTIGNSPLPITLKSFNGYVDNGKHYLEWVTSAEINNERFELERSSDGIHYEVIGVVNGAGNSSEEKKYHYIDKLPFYGNNYYRLKQIDFDGQSSFEGGVVLLENLNENVSLSYVMYPNPTSSSNINLNIVSMDLERKAHIGIYDLQGRLLYDKLIDTNEFNEPIQLSINQKLRSGLYLMVVEQGEEKVQKKLLIK